MGRRCKPSAIKAAAAEEAGHGKGHRRWHEAAADQCAEGCGEEGLWYSSPLAAGAATADGPRSRTAHCHTSAWAAAAAVRPGRCLARRCSRACISQHACSAEQDRPAQSRSRPADHRQQVRPQASVPCAAEAAACMRSKVTAAAGAAASMQRCSGCQKWAPACLVTAAGFQTAP